MRLLAIQELRAVAALLVVVHHALTTVAQYDFGLSRLARLGQFYDFGNAGVDIFFVISGFIMMYTLARRRGRDSWHGFLMRRVTRVVPLYWVLTSVLLALMLLLPALFPHSRPVLGHTLASYLFIPYANVRGDMYPLLVPGWTLTFEMLFYLLFALLLFLRESRIVPALTAVFAGFILAVRLWAPEQPVLAWLANPMVFEFVFGCFVARVYLNLRRRPDWLPPLLIGLALALFAATIAWELGWMPRALRWGVPAMLLVAGAALLPDPAAPVGQPRRALAALGDASYSLYLSHPFVLPAIAKLWRLLGLQEHLPPDLYVLLATLASCAAAFGTYHLLERPLVLALRGRGRRAPAAAAPRGA